MQRIPMVRPFLALWLILATNAELRAVGPPQQSKLPPRKHSSSTPEFIEDISPVGAPKADKGISQRVWSDDKGWHVVVHSTSLRVFRGKIRVVGGRILKADGAGSGENHHPKTGKNGMTKPGNVDEGRWTPEEIQYRFETSTGHDTVHFLISPEVRYLEFHFQIDQEDLPLDRIFIGREGKHPSRQTFLLRANAKG